MQAMTKTKLNTFMFEKDKIEDITSVLRKGGLILYPTDTIWGIGCDASNVSAIDKIYQLKQRATSRNFVILVREMMMLFQMTLTVLNRSFAIYEIILSDITLVSNGVMLNMACSSIKFQTFISAN